MFKSRICVWIPGLIGIVLLLAGAVPSGAQTVVPASEEGRLIATLTSPDASRKDKVDACRLLSIIGTRQAVPALASLLGDPEMSHMARYALEPIPDPSVDRALRDALGTVRGRPLIGVIASIGVRRDAEAVEPLAQMLRQGQMAPEAMGAAIRALGQIGTVAASRVLTMSLDHAPPEGLLDVYEALLCCAERLAAEGNRSEATAIYDRLRKVKQPHQVRAGALQGAILIRRGQERAELIREHLRSDDYVLFAATCQTALELPAPAVTRALTDALPQLPTENKILVIQTLGRRGDTASLPALFNAARAPATVVRVAALKAMPEIAHPLAVPVLVELMADASGEVSQAARESLAALPGREADQAVMTMFQSGDSDKRLVAVEMMGRRRMTQAVPALLEAAGTTGGSVRVAVIRMTGELGGPDRLPALLALLDELESSQDLDAARLAIGRVCAKADDPQTVSEVLVGRLDQVKLPQKIVLLRILGGVGGPTALRAVRRAVNDRNSDVRTAAIRALGTWQTTDAAPELLGLARSASDATERMLALRSYIGFCGRRDLATDVRLSMCRQAAPLVQRDQEKTLLLGALGGIDSPEAVDLIAGYLTDDATRQTAVVAALGIADRLLSHRDAKAYAARLIEPLEKVAEAAPSGNLRQQAEKLLEQARSKAGR